MIDPSLLMSPITGGPVSVAAADGSGTVEDQAGHSWPVVRGVPRFVPADDYSESFGFQWNTFEVRRVEEDLATFAVKTGVEAGSLAGKRVLDAGCGGGRYARVCGDAGATVLGVDRSRAVDKARELTRNLDRVTIVQADLVDLPAPAAAFDLVFSIGVLHHGPDPRASFRSIARAVKPGGRLSVWLYRRCLPPLEWINGALRRRTTRMPADRLMRWCRLGARIGGIPVLGKLLNKLVPFSAHPDPELRLCDTFDWYAPTYQSHHSVRELSEWFRAEGFTEIRELPPANRGGVYRWFHDGGWLMGSGVNVTGVRLADDPRATT